MEKQIDRASAAHVATKILVDYFCFTVSVSEFCGYDPDYWDGKPSESLALRIENKFFLAGLEFQQRKGLYGYTCSAWYDGIVYAYGGADTIYIQLSGTGCRTWESTHPGLAWERWIAYLQASYKSLHVSRLDIACDTFGLLKLRTLQAYTRASRYISQWRTYLIQEGSAEMAVIWGSSKSDFRLRIYDKTLERIVKGGVDESTVPKGWVRCEFQLRNDAAASFIRSWQANGNIGLTFCGIMRNQLLYVSKYDGKNRDRATLAKWWQKLLGDGERIHMAYDAGKDYNFDSLKRFVFHQAGSSLKAYLSIMDGDITTLLSGINSATLNDRQLELIRSQHIVQQNLQIDKAALVERWAALGLDNDITPNVVC